MKRIVKSALVGLAAVLAISVAFALACCALVVLSNAYDPTRSIGQAVGKILVCVGFGFAVFVAAFIYHNRPPTQ